MLRLHEEIELRAWSLLCQGRISYDHYCAIVDSSWVSFRMWLEVRLP